MSLASMKHELVCAYLEGVNLTAIIISVGPDQVQTAFEIAAWPGHVPASGSEIIAQFAFEKAGHAELVIAQCDAGLHAIEGRDNAIRVFNEAVAAVGAQWQSADQVIAQAAAVIDDLDGQVKAWNASGGLAVFNAAYKAYRKLCLATFQPVEPYSGRLHLFKLRIANLVGKNVAAGKMRFDGVTALKPDAMPTIKRRDHINVEDFERWPGRHRDHGVIPGWTPSLKAHPVEHKAARIKPE